MRGLAGLMCVLIAGACGGDDDDDVAAADAAAEVDSGGGGGVDAAARPDGAGETPDAAPSADADPMPETLAESGLYSDAASETLAPGVRPFSPRFQLWSDGAEKRRWIYLPLGAQIDSTDMDFWRFPAGTKVWKEFTSEGTRVETRMLYKNGDGVNDWYMVAYAWNEEQTEAAAAPSSGVTDALGTTHDIPSQAQCRTCHTRTPGRLLGVSAIQLDSVSDSLTLSELVANGQLTSVPSGPPPWFEVPGDDVERAAIGYLHANCGNCHNETSDVAGSTPLRAWLTTADLIAVEATPIYLTAVGQPNVLEIEGVTALIEPGIPSASAVHARMSVRTAIQMPPLGTDVVDDAGLAAIDAWIVALGGV